MQHYYRDKISSSTEKRPDQNEHHQRENSEDNTENLEKQSKSQKLSQTDIIRKDYDSQNTTNFSEHQERAERATSDGQYGTPEGSEQSFSGSSLDFESFTSAAPLHDVLFSEGSNRSTRNSSDGMSIDSGFSLKDLEADTNDVQPDLIDHQKIYEKIYEKTSSIEKACQELAKKKQDLSEDMSIISEIKKTLSAKKDRDATCMDLVGRNDSVLQRIYEWKNNPDSHQEALHNFLNSQENRNLDFLDVQIDKTSQMIEKNREDAKILHSDNMDTSAIDAEHQRLKKVYDALLRRYDTFRSEAADMLETPIQQASRHMKEMESVLAHMDSSQYDQKLHEDYQKLCDIQHQLEKTESDLHSIQYDLQELTNLTQKTEIAEELHDKMNFHDLFAKQSVIHLKEMQDFTRTIFEDVDSYRQGLNTQRENQQEQLILALAHLEGQIPKDYNPHLPPEYAFSYEAGKEAKSIEQQLPDSCVIAASRVCLGDHGIHITEKQAATDFQYESGGVPFINIVNGMRMYDVETHLKTFRTFNECSRALNDGNPAIVLLNGKSGAHALVFDQAQTATNGDKYIIYRDPFYPMVEARAIPYQVLRAKIDLWGYIISKKENMPSSFVPIEVTSSS